MKRICIAAAVLIALPAFAYDSIEDVIKHMTKPDPAPVKVYLAEHPNAPDADKAEEFLAAMYVMTDHRDEAIRIHEQRYEKMLAKKAGAKDGDLRNLIRDMLDACIEAGQRDHAKELIAKIEKDFAGDKNEKSVQNALIIPRDELKIPLVGETMEIAMKAMDGRDVDLAAMKGKVVLVEYWSTTCAPCIAEFPKIKKAYDAFHDKGFEVVAIPLDDDKAKLEKFLAKRDLPWPQLFASGLEDSWKHPLASKYGIHSIPQLFLIGKDGVIAAVNPRKPGELEKKVSEALAK